MYAGIDLGASSLKITICDQAGRVRAESACKITTRHPQPGYSEQQPAEWLKALQAAFALLAKNRTERKAIKGIAVSAGTHSFVPLDTSGAPLSAALMWSDQRAATMAAKLAREHGETIVAIGKNRIQPTWSLAMLAWLQQHRPQLLKKTRRICFAKDYIRQWLCDALTATHWLTDPGDAAGSLLADHTRMQWSETLCQLAGITTLHLPRITASLDQAGTLGASAANALGLSAGAPVYTGCIDTTSELLPLGQPKPGTTLLKFASAGVWSRVISRPLIHPQASLYPALFGLWYHSSGTNNCAAAFDWGTRLLWGNVPPATFDAAIKRALARGAITGLPIFHPYLLGERAPLWNGDLRAGFSGIGIQHGRDQLALSIAEGIIHALRHARDLSELSQPDATISVTGGLANCPGFMRLAASLLHQPLQCLAHGDASYGSALVAALAAGVLSPDQLDALAKHNQTICHQPDAELAGQLNSRHQRYLQLLPGQGL